jgi:hypothetical protein
MDVHEMEPKRITAGRHREVSGGELRAIKRVAITEFESVAERDSFVLSMSQA